MTETFALHAVLGVMGGGIGIFCLSFILYWKLIAEPHYRQKRSVKRTVEGKQAKVLATLELQR